MSYTVEDTERIWMNDHPDFPNEAIERIDGDAGRWNLWVTEIHVHGTTGEHWAIEVGEALTEMQEHEFREPPYRVEPREVIVPATTRIDWVKV
jgi:hypothetical protein